MDGNSTSLPVTRYAKDILETVKLNPITIVIGETGSGKTTQIAQASIYPVNEGQVLECDCWDLRVVAWQPTEWYFTSLQRHTHILCRS